MKLQCQFEQDLLDAVAARRWPDRADAALRDHVGTCGICSDIAEIAGAFLDDRDSARLEGMIPSSSAIWWRSQIRAREEAERIAVRPMIVFQIAATVCAAVLAILIAPSASAWVRQAIGALGMSDWWMLPRDFSLSWLLRTTAYTTLPLIAACIWVVLAPVLVYLALDD
jgi:hypothetical protein